MEYSLDGTTYVSSNIFTSGITVGSTQTFYIRNVGTTCTASGSQLINCNCPSVTGNTISSAQSICSGETPAALTGILPTINPATTFTYQWQSSSDNTTWTDITSATNKDYTPGALTQTTYYRRKVKISNCPDDNSTEVKITVNPKPVFTNVSVVCAGSTLTSATVNGTLSSGTMEYSLDGTTYVSSNIFTSGITVGSTQNFFIRNVGTTCTASGSQLINCNCPTVTGNTISSAQSICSGKTPAALTGLIPTINPATTFTYQWQSSSDNINWTDITGETLQDYIPVTLSQTIFYRRAIKLSGCSPDFSASIKITVNLNPNLKITNPSEICEPNNVNLLDPSITNGSTNIGNLIYYSDAGLNTVINNPSAYSQIGTTTLYVKTTNSNGCTDNKPLTVKINPLDIINIISPTSLCSNATLKTLNATPINGTWAGSGIKPNGALQASTAAIGTNDYTYTSVGKCPNSKTVQIKINQKPNLIISKKDTVCEGEEVILQDVSPYTNLITCKWDFGDNNYSTTLKETKHKYFSSGSFDVTLIGTDAIGCSDTITEKEFIHVLKRPKTNFMYSPTNPTIFNNTIQTTNLSVNATNYQWNFGDETKSLLTNPSHEYGNTPNIYFITLNAYNKETSCNHDTTIQIEVFDEIYFYVPNSFTPNGDEINNEFKPILSGSVAEENYSLYIFNRWGQLLFESHNKNVGWNGAFGNKISSPGTYIWKIEFTDTINKVKHMKTGHVNLVN
jgi:gliding motility-associated-like protein